MIDDIYIIYLPLKDPILIRHQFDYICKNNNNNNSGHKDCYTLILMNTNPQKNNSQNLWRNVKTFSC